MRPTGPITGEIQRDARLWFNQIAKQVNLSAPPVTARIHPLEQPGVIEGHHAHINPAAAELHCHPGRCPLTTSAAEQFPQNIETHRLSGNSYTTIKLPTASMAHLSSPPHRIDEHAHTNSHTMPETLEHHTPQIPPPVPAPTRHRGWSG
jgi:Lrp/AsnC family transcriptional regulator, leucine-responsive regulatory protein